MKNTGQLIADLIDKRDITQRELAEMVGVTEVTISRYINNSRQPKSDILFKIARALGVPADYFNTDSSTQCVKIDNAEKDQTTKKVESIITEFPEGIDVLMRAKDELTPAQKKKMLQMITLFLDSLDEK